MTTRSILAKAKSSKTAIVGEVFTGYIRPLLETCVKVTGSREAYDYINPLWPERDYYESFCVMLTSRSNHIIGHSFVSKGGVSGTVADPKIIFQKALAANASGFIVAHNHPSGNMIASQADIDLTKKLREAGKFLEIQLLDHIILCGDKKYFSFADEGMI